MSIWLTVIPIKRSVFFLDKQAFWDAIRIRYSIPLKRLPILCVCGDLFNLQHALSCPKGELVITRHNELKNLTAEILGEVCKNVVVEPLLTLLTGEELPKSSNTYNQAMADVSARGLWINGQTAFCDVRVFNPWIVHTTCVFSFWGNEQGMQQFLFAYCWTSCYQKKRT